MDMSVFDCVNGIGRRVPIPWTMGRRGGSGRIRSMDPVVASRGCMPLALTGVGHATDKAVILGLMGETPQDVAPDEVDSKLAAIEAAGEIALLGTHVVPFTAATGLVWHKSESLPEHPNGMRFTLKLADGSRVDKVYYSIGGGFIREAEEVQTAAQAEAAVESAASARVVFPFDTMEQLLAHGVESGLSIPEMLRANECVKRSDED